MPAKEFMTLLDVLQQEGTGSIKALTQSVLLDLHPRK